MEIVILSNPKDSVAVAGCTIPTCNNVGNTNCCKFLIAAQKFLISFNSLFSSLNNRISREGVLSVSLRPFGQQLTDVMYLVT